MLWLNEGDMPALALGASILGAGGGGDPSLGRIMACRALERRGPVRLLSPHEVPDDALIVPVGVIGAPVVMSEKLPVGDEVVRAVSALEEHLGRRAAAIMPIECGGVNALLPVVAAAEKRLPLIDADGMGRAFPELQMVSYHIYGLRGSPCVLCDERGATVLLEAPDNLALERLVRDQVVRMGGVGYAAVYSMSGADMKETALPGTLSLALRLGRAVEGALAGKCDVLTALREVTANSTYGPAVVLFRGKVVEVTRTVVDGFSRGRVVLEGVRQYQGKTCEVTVQNENLMAQVDGCTVVTVPDIIALVDMDSGFPLTNDELRYGYRVTVLGIPTPEMTRTPQALEVWGPRAFGLDEPYVPLEPARGGWEGAL